MSSQPSSTYRLIVAVLIVMVVVNIALAGMLLLPGLKQATPTTPAILPSPSPSAAPTITLTPPPGATPAPTATPVSAQEALRQQGVIILSMSDGAHIHLFAYHPQYLPLTRLTTGAWDDIHPAVNAQGTQVAFSSRQNGYWDLFIYDLASGKQTRVTDTPEYEGAPTWSPDQAWLAYESLTNNTLQVVVRSLTNPTQPVMELTSGPGANYSPTWSPQGREIAFVSTRDGSEDIWVARLDRVDDRFINLTSTSTGRNRHPRWSPDGRYLAWASDAPGISTLYVWDSQTADSAPRALGNGDFPVWKPDAKAILAEIRSPNQTSIGGYNLADGGLIFPANRMPGALHGMDWKAGQIAQSLAALKLPESARLPASTLWKQNLTKPNSGAVQRAVLAPLKDVTVPSPYLHDAVDEAFNALRQHIASLLGWDFLANLDNAYLPLTSPTHPGQEESWLYTGRAFSVNSAPINAGWMALEREDIGGLTYWRVFLRARIQDGSQGKPISQRPWDMQARYRGSPGAYEQGGAYGAIPAGYWVDFTEIAARYGWERLPAQVLWRTFYPAAFFDVFVMREGLDWRSAMAQLYPQEAILTPTPIYTFTPTITSTPTPWYNWMITPSLTATLTPSATRRPTFTPNP